MEQNPHLLPVPFRGLKLSGNPTRRPRFTAAKAEDVRVMPGNWIRLRSGRKARKNTAGGEVRQIHAFRDPNLPGASSHMAQIKYPGAGTVNWTWFSTATYTIDPFGIAPISTAYDGGFALTNPAAICNIIDRPVFYNGLGVRDGSNSRPALSSYAGGVVRYFGLDAYCPTGKPTASWSPGGGGYNTVASSIKLAVGLYHEPTGHFSNGVDIGSIGAQTGNGVITVSNLNRLAAAYNNGTEQGELYYVFYATIDGYQVPYLIMNAALTGPHKVPISSTSASLSIMSGGNGWVLDTTSEAPVKNFPPRPMRAIASVNNRLYGIPMTGGSGGGSDFSYPFDSRATGSVVWSAAAGDESETKGVGDPLQSWPLENRKYTPNSETPVWVAPSLAETDLLVWTPGSLYILRELSSGLHQWATISRIHGLRNPMTVRVTPYGIIWVNQRNQVCLLQSEDPASVKVISGDYQGVLRGKTVNCADYVLDPIGQSDCYMVICSDGLRIYHEFGLIDDDFPNGQAFTATGPAFTAAATLVTPLGERHYVLAGGGFYTHESQPENGLIPTTDMTFNNAVDQTFTETQINGTFLFNWDDQGDWRERVKLAAVDFIGDGKQSAALTGERPIAMRWWGDYQPVPGTVTVVKPQPTSQSTIEFAFRFIPKTPDRFVFKMGFTISGHSSDDPAFANYTPVDQEGDLAKNFYGSICSLALLFGNQGNHP